MLSANVNRAPSSGRSLGAKVVPVAKKRRRKAKLQLGRNRSMKKAVFFALSIWIRSSGRVKVFSAVLAKEQLTDILPNSFSFDICLAHCMFPLLFDANEC